VSMNANYGSTQYRNYPDVAAIARVAIQYDTGELNGWVGAEGTSVAAPVWAGDAALANQFGCGSSASAETRSIPRG
jgi:subtilase family serine protease